MTYRVLVLTEHHGHSAENSIYALLQELYQHPAIRCVKWASRSFSKNQSFFSGENMHHIHVSTVDDAFNYDSAQLIDEEDLEREESLSFDAIFMRLPRPITDDYLIQLANFFSDKYIFNHPLGIVETSNKKFLLQFPELTVPIQLCQSVDDVIRFVALRETVLKPLRDYGGKGLIRIRGEEAWLGDQPVATSTLLEQIKPELTENGYLAMAFLSNVVNGDKRLLVVDGEIMAASLRKPAEGSWLCNVAQGGQSVPAEADEAEQRIVAHLSPVLKEKGIFICGVDTLENDEGERVLSEINTLSIGGFPQAQKQTGRPVIPLTIQKMVHRIKEFYGH